MVLGTIHTSSHLTKCSGPSLGSLSHPKEWCCLRAGFPEGQGAANKIPEGQGSYSEQERNH